jgi:hypothetical protein
LPTEIKYHLILRSFLFCPLSYSFCQTKIASCLTQRTEMRTNATFFRSASCSGQH